MLPIYAVSDPQTDRWAKVVVVETRGDCPYVAHFYERETLDHLRRYSRAGMAEAAADYWCGKSA